MTASRISKTLRTDAWVLDVPTCLDESAPLLCIPTVHPRGDRRIMRCAQVALDAGFRLCFIWLGEGNPSTHPLVREILLPRADSFRQRFGQIGAVASEASRQDPDAWHIHDYYLLRAALRWHRRTDKPVVYDVHEYYAQYYASKLPLPGFARRIAARGIERYQVHAAKQFGGADVVAQRMAAPFAKAGVPVACTPNYPLLSQYESVDITPFAARRFRAVHIGSLAPSYGWETLIRIAQRSRERGLPFEFTAIARFSSDSAREQFESMLEAAGNPLVLEPAVPAHEVPRVLSGFGFGLSLITGNGQNELAIPAKSFEHAVMGLVPVVSDRRAQREFVQAVGPHVVLREAGIDQCLDDMLAVAADPENVDARVRIGAEEARRSYTWNAAAAPQLVQLYRTVAPMVDRAR